MTIDVPYINDVVEVSIAYSPGWVGNREEPPEPEEIEIISVRYKGINVTDIVDLEVIEEDIYHKLQGEERNLSVLLRR